MSQLTATQANAAKNDRGPLMSNAVRVNESSESVLRKCRNLLQRIQQPQPESPQKDGTTAMPPIIVNTENNLSQAEKLLDEISKKIDQLIY